MSESTKETVEVEESTPVENQVNKQAEVSPVDLQQQWDNLQGLAIINPGLLQTEEYKKIESEMKEAIGKVSKAPAKSASKAKASEEEGEEEEEEVEDKGKKSNPFGLNTAKKGKKEINPALEKIDQDALKDVIKGFGAEDPSKFFEEIVPKWRNDSQALVKVQEEYDGLNEELGRLPDDIKSILLAYSNGQDWKEAVAGSGGRPDFNSDFEKLDGENLVKFYYKDRYKSLSQKYEDGDYDEEDFKERIEMLRDAAKPLFERDKKVFENQRAAYMQEAETSEKMLRSSATSSVDALKKEYPDFSKGEIQRIRQFLVNGNIESLLKDKSGAYTENAAKVIAFAMFGEDLVKDLLDQAKNQGTTTANLEIVERGKKTIQSSKAIENAQNQAQAKAVEHLKMVQPQSNPYL